MVSFPCKDKYSFSDLVEIMAILRSRCPWDREQTHESIRRNLLEEAYEAAEAIDLADTDLLKEELGDVLLQVVFHARMEEERGVFGISDVCDGICKKLITRHPHVFGGETAKTSGDVLSKWDDIKRKGKGHSSHTQAMTAVAKSLPALLRSEKVQSKAGKAGFDFDRTEDALLKLREELSELEVSIESGEGVEEELGDLLFAAVNVARFLGADSEYALEKTTDKFISRFSYVENELLKRGKIPENSSLSEMDKLWEEAKALEK